MRSNILNKFKKDLLDTLGEFEEESGGRHNRRPEISAAMSTLNEYIKLAENPLVLLNTLEAYIRNHLTGFLKSMIFRDEHHLKKRLTSVFLKPEYSLQSLSHSLHHESELEKLELYRLIAQLEERLRSLEREKDSGGFNSINAVSLAEFEELRAKISHLEECERQAQLKISELEDENWLKEREIIVLRGKVESLSVELEQIRAENEALKAEKLSVKPAHKEPEKIVKKSASQLIYQNNSKSANANRDETNSEESCRIF